MNTSFFIGDRLYSFCWPFIKTPLPSPSSPSPVPRPSPKKLRNYWTLPKFYNIIKRRIPHCLCLKIQPHRHHQLAPPKRIFSFPSAIFSPSSENLLSPFSKKWIFFMNNVNINPPAIPFDFLTFAARRDVYRHSMEILLHENPVSFFNLFCEK